MVFVSTIANEDGAPETLGSKFKMMHGTFTVQTAATEVSTAGTIVTGLPGSIAYFEAHYVQTAGETPIATTSSPTHDDVPKAGPNMGINVVTNMRGVWIAWGKP